MRKTAFLALLLVTSACQETVVPHYNPTITFNGPSYALNVAQINILEDYQSSKVLPHVEKLASITPAQAVKQWASSKLSADGKTGYAEVSIEDAHILKKDLAKQKTGIEGLFTSEQTEEYDGALEVEIKIYDGVHVLPMAHISAKSESMRTLGEDSTVLDHQNTYFDITEELIKSLELELDRNIERNFKAYLVQD